jgi:hypothetical protein
MKRSRILFDPRVIVALMVHWVVLMALYGD